MQPKQHKLPVITNELLEALDELFPEKTPDPRWSNPVERQR